VHPVVARLEVAPHLSQKLGDFDPRAAGDAFPPKWGDPVGRRVVRHLVLTDAGPHGLHALRVRVPRARDVRPAALRSLRRAVGPPDRHGVVRRSVPTRPVPLPRSCSAIPRRASRRRGRRCPDLILSMHRKEIQIRARPLLEGRPDGGHDLRSHLQHFLMVLRLRGDQVDQITRTISPIHLCAQ
jgi:hypothetical protein